MTPKRYSYAMIAVLVVLIGLIIGGTIGGNFLLQQKSEKLNSLKLESKLIEEQQKALLQAKRDVEKYSELEKIAKSVVPQDKDQAKTIREIVQLAEVNKIPIKSVVFDSSTLGETATTKGKAPAVSQLKPVDGISGVYTLELEVESAKEVSYQSFLSFLENLEKNRRTAHVGSIKLAPSDDGQSLSFNITVNAYVKP